MSDALLGATRREAPVRLDTLTAITGPLAEDCWHLYRVAFDELRTMAVQRHVLLREEFDAVLADERVTKYFAVDETGHVAALATGTTDLTAMPLVSPDYFAHRWPQLYATRRIWYVGFVAVRPDRRRGPLFGQIIRDIGGAAARVGGVAVMDVSRQVAAEKKLPQALTRFFTRLAPGTRAIRLDEQTYWAYEFPAVAVGASSPVRCASAP
jgi:hypothetical protein